MDSVKVMILPDGRIKLETGRFGPAVHTTADRFVAEVLKLAGGAVERGPGGEHGHSHEDGHSHDYVHGGLSRG